MLASGLERKRSDDRAVVDGDHPLASWTLSFDPRAE
jgi:FKBP-type peptidyl-prolyl cis-trans isomerase 2